MVSVGTSEHLTGRKGKGEAFGRIAGYFAEVERKFGKTPRWIRMDNGKEMVNEQLTALCAAKGIEIQPTAPYSPSQNGVAERLNRTLLEAARAMLIAKNMPAYLWDEAVATAVYIRNRVLTSALSGMTPYEAYYGTMPRVGHLPSAPNTTRRMTTGIQILRKTDSQKSNVFSDLLDHSLPRSLDRDSHSAH